MLKKALTFLTDPVDVSMPWVTRWLAAFDERPSAPGRWAGPRRSCSFSEDDVDPLEDPEKWLETHDYVEGTDEVIDAALEELGF